MNWDKNEDAPWPWTKYVLIKVRSDKLYSKKKKLKQSNNIEHTYAWALNSAFDDR